MLKKLTNLPFLNLYERKTKINGQDKTYFFASRKDQPSIKPYTADAATTFVFNKDKSKMLLIKEFRPVVDSYVIASPAGLVDPSENPVETAVRELKEETGYDVLTIDAVLPASYSSIGLTDEATTSVFIRVDEHQATKNQQEATEDITHFWITKEDALYFLKNQKLPEKLQKELNLPNREIGITARTQLVLMQFIGNL